jgi:hypothetical protein
MKFPLRSELTILPADKPTTKIIGFTVHEIQSVGVYNPMGLRRLDLSSINIDACRYYECAQNPHTFYKAKDGMPFVFGVCDNHTGRMHAKTIFQNKDYEEISYEEAIAYAIMLT